MKFVEITEKTDNLSSCILLSRIQAFGDSGDGGSFVVLDNGENFVCVDKYEDLKTQIMKLTEQS